MGIRREANALCVSLCNVSPILNFLHSHDDRFAAQIVYATGRNAPAPKVSGRLSATRELRSVSTDRRSLPKAVTRVVPQGPAPAYVPVSD